MVVGKTGINTLSLDVFFKKVSEDPGIKKEEVKELLKEYLQRHGFKKASSHQLTRTIYLDLSEVQKEDPHLYSLIQQNMALCLSAFYEALKELGIDTRGFSIGFTGGSRQ